MKVEYYYTLGKYTLGRTGTPITTNDPFFEGKLIVLIDDFSITFKKPTIDYSGKLYTVTISKKVRCISINKSKILPEEEKQSLEYSNKESNEDQVVLYYN